MSPKTLLKKIIRILKRRIEIYKELIRLWKEKLKLPKETIEEMIKRIADEYDVDPHLAERVARCESGLDPKAVNVNRNKTIDRGLFQWNDYWHTEISDECAYDPECATREFCKAVKRGKLGWWNASRPCWDQSYKYSQ